MGITSTPMWLVVVSILLCSLLDPVPKTPPTRKIVMLGPPGFTANRFGQVGAWRSLALRLGVYWLVSYVANLDFSFLSIPEHHNSHGITLITKSMLSP